MGNEYDENTLCKLVKCSGEKGFLSDLKLKVQNIYNLTNMA